MFRAACILLCLVLYYTYPLSAQTVTQTSSLSSVVIDEALKGTGLAGLGAMFKYAEVQYGINAKFLVAVAYLESGAGHSALFLKKNNAFGFGIVDDEASTAVSFSSPEKAILRVASYIRNEYVSPQGMWYNGDTVDAVGMKYSTDANWPQKIEALEQQLFPDAPLPLDSRTKT